jgi:spore coat protein H
MRISSLRFVTPLGILAASVLLLGGCGSSTEVDDEDSNSDRGSEWVESSHGKVDPDTAKAFPATRRNLTLAIPETTWTAMIAHLSEACGGTTACSGTVLDGFPNVSEWHMADLYADGQKWASVGLKLPSNGDLADAWTAGAKRFPFRITMDKWETAVPSIENQRFYGFQKLSLNNLEDDSSGIKHQIAGVLYRSQGVPAFRSTLVSLKLAHGEDTLDLGLYSMREMLDGPMLNRWFTGNDGNLYEPTSTLATFLAADFAEGDNDGTYSDAKLFVMSLNAANRTLDRAAWRTNLAASFDIDGFLSWLAISTAVGDKGSYGSEAENYALYADGGKLHWMALDIDDAFPSGAGLTRGVWHAGSTGTWPLIANVLADSVYCESYKAKLRGLVSGPVSTTNLKATIQSIADASLAGLSDATQRTTKLSTFADQRAGVVDTSISNHACPYGI